MICKCFIFTDTAAQNYRECRETPGAASGGVRGPGADQAGVQGGESQEAAPGRLAAGGQEAVRPAEAEIYRGQGHR